MPRLRLLSTLCLAAFTLLGWSAPAHAQWTAVNNPTANLDTCLLLTDGTVMCHVYNTNRWRRLTPDNLGSYANGTWADTATMPNGTDTSNVAGSTCAPCTFAPLYFASAVLPDGRVVVIGGEYNTNSSATNPSTPTRTNIGFLYDPVADTWSTQLTEPFGTGGIGDAMSTVLANGTMLLAAGAGGQAGNGNVATFDPATLTFTALNPGGKADSNNEEGWNILPDGRILTVDARIDLQSEIYDPVTNTWGNRANTGVLLADTATLGNSAEVGPGVLRPDNTLVYFSGNSLGQNAVYDVATNTWSNAAAMDFPTSAGTNHFAVADGPASLLPNGNVLVMASPTTNANPFNAPSHFYEFSLTTNTLTAVTDSPNAASFIAYQGRMVLLPTGQVLLTAFDQSSTQDVQLYSNGGGPQDAWRPVITGAPKSVDPGSSYSISGKLFNGFSEGASYGDDAQSSTNFPIVRLTNRASGHVFYARTRNHSRMGVQAITSNEIITTQFDTPASLETGLTDLEVVANGIPSKKFVVNGPGLTIPGPLSMEACAGSTATTTLNICNTGKQDLSINNITSNRSSVTVDNPGYSVVISPDFCFPFQAHFTPTGPGTTNATLTINSNDPNNPQSTVAVTGASSAPSINTTLVNSGIFANTCTGDQSDAPILYVTNQGQCNLVISNIQSSDANFLTPTTSLPLTLTAHQTVPLPVRFQPVGSSCSNTVARTGVISITSNDPVNGVLDRNVSGLSPCPALNTIVANTGSFGNVCAGTQSDLNLQLVNQGQCNLNITSLTSSNGNFELPAGTTFPLVLSHDANATVPIRFKPTGVCSDTVPQTSNVTVNSNDPLGPKVIGVNGIEGCPRIVLSPQNLTGIFAFPATVSDPTGNLGCYTDRQISIGNAGSCPLTITALTAAAADTFNVINPTVPLTIGPGASPVPVTIRFKPTVLTGQIANAPDEQTGTLTIVSNDPVGPSATLCGEPTVRSGVRLLVTNGVTTPYNPVASITLSSKGLSPGVMQKDTNVPLFTTNVCNNTVRYHIDNETLAPAGTTGSNPKASYLFAVKVGGKPGDMSFTLGQCEVKEAVIKIK